VCRGPDRRKRPDREETIFEISDLAYHLMVLMVQMGIAPKDILSQLASRHVVDKKVKQEKMQ
jgi:phosphoribosyl-ATP pyrophosphohydrolase/phosphoribosyl-AMP cyclohydrolase